jgi:hypothetical protein
MARSKDDLFRVESARVAVYHLWASNDVLLYVGVSKAPGHRIATHRRLKPWGSLIHHWDIEWCRTRFSALTAEAKAIDEERPLFNIEMNEGREQPWELMLDERTPPLKLSRIPQFAEAALVDLRLLELLRNVQGHMVEGCCGECLWPKVKAAAEKLVGFRSENEALTEPRLYEAVMSTLYESLPWACCELCGAA